MYKIKYLSFLISLFIFISVSGQKGHLFISDIEIDERIVDHSIRCIDFDNESFAFVGSRKGIALFDGKNWQNINNVPVNVFSIKYDTSKQKLYCGFKNEFGVISKSLTGSQQYKSLKKFDQEDIEFTKANYTNTEVVFYSDKSIFIVNRKNDSILFNLASQKYGLFQGIVIQNNSIFVNIKNKGIHKLSKGELIKQNMGTDLKNSQILFYTYFNKKNILVGTNDNKIYLFDGKKFMQYANHTGIRDFLKENLLWNGIDISGEYFAVTTLTGGCAIIDKNYGKIIDIINYQTGLPDDEILTIALDKDNGLWLAHEHGLSRCDFSLPIRNFSTYPGLSGIINDVLITKNKLYVATNNGVFYLEKIKSRNEREVIVRKAETLQTSKSKKSKSRKAKEESDQLFEKRKEYSLQSITHHFKPVLNLNEKCKQLYFSDNIILVATNFGLFEIYDTLALPVTPNLYVNSLCFDKDTSIVFVASLDGMHLLFYQNTPNKLNNWKEKKIFNALSFPINSVVQDTSGVLFFGTDSKVYRSVKNSKIHFEEPIQLELPEIINEPINLRKIDNQVVLIQSVGILDYNTITHGIFYKDIKAVLSNNLQYVLGRNDAWVKDSLNWEPAIASAYKKDTKILSAFSKLRRINSDKQENLWVINGSYELLKLSPKTVNNIQAKFEVQIVSVTDNSDTEYPLVNPVFEYSNNAVNILVAAPYYIQSKQIQYQYYVDGLKHYEKWSGWSINNTIELSSVPPGKYTVLVRAKNVFEQISETKKVEFKVLLPFWKTKPFYISATILFILFIALIFYLSHRQLLKKKRILEQKIIERTIELQAEKDRVNALLKNILPQATIEELKKYNKVTPRNYDNATVLFTDFKGFTFIAEKLSPEELVNEIDTCFKAFDKIIDKYKIEKIKTIGDAYMCAGGLPEKYKNNAFEVVMAALDIRDFMETYKTERIQNKKPFFEIRIGIHTGPVVAGIVGIRKYAYDIWGDTVNVASRMESSGEPGKVNISGDTYNIVKGKFDCEYRGKVSAKNKGEVEMYFVNGLLGKKTIKVK